MTNDYEKNAREISRLVYEDRMERKRMALDLQGAYGRWLIASLLLIHGGAFLFLAQGEEFGQRILAVTHWWFVTGLLLALVCGFVTWINWGVDYVYLDEMNPAIIFETKSWPDAPKGRPLLWINLTFWLSILSGLASKVCIFGAAVWASSTL